MKISLNTIIPLPIRTSIVYLILGGIWIVFSDKLFLVLFPDIAQYSLFQSGKGLLFVILTCCFLYYMLKTNINTQNRLFNELKEHEKFVHLAIEAGRIGVFSLHIRDNEIYVNDSFMAGVGKYNEQLRFHSLNEFISMMVFIEDQSKVKSAFESVINGEHISGHITFRLGYTHSTSRWMQLRLVVNTNNDSDRIIGVIVDCTDQKRLEHSLNENRLLYKNMLSNIVGMVYQCDFNKPSPKVFISDGCRGLTGLHPEEFKAHYNLLGNFIYKPDRDAVWRSVIQSVKDNTNYALQYRIKRNDGSIRWVEDRGKAALDKSGLLIFLMGIIHDITDRVEAEELVNSAILDTEYNERNRIAREIHDGLQQTLTSSFLQFQGLKSAVGNLEAKSKDKFMKGEELLNKAIQESREIAHRLIPRDVENAGIVQAMENVVAAIHISDMHITFNHNDIDSNTISKSIQLVIYRVFQEAINNIRKYAGNCKVDVQLFQYPEKLMLMIEDNGKGFDIKDPNKKTGMGLANMKQRATNIGGFLEIDSFTGRGTSILLEIPLVERNIDYVNPK